MGPPSPAQYADSEEEEKTLAFGKLLHLPAGRGGEETGTGHAGQVRSTGYLTTEGTSAPAAKRARGEEVPRRPAARLNLLLPAGFWRTLLLLLRTAAAAAALLLLPAGFSTPGRPTTEITYVKGNLKTRSCEARTERQNRPRLRAAPRGKMELNQLEDRRRRRR
jgi:hypothetical protein